MTKLIILRLSLALVALCTLGAVAEAKNRHPWELITDLVMALFFGALALLIKGWGA